MWPPYIWSTTVIALKLPLVLQKFQTTFLTDRRMQEFSSIINISNMLENLWSSIWKSSECSKCSQFNFHFRAVLIDCYGQNIPAMEWRIFTNYLGLSQLLPAQANAAFSQKHLWTRSFCLSKENIFRHHVMYQTTVHKDVYGGVAVPWRKKQEMVVNSVYHPAT